MNDAKRVLIICAHSDDQVIGAGGTMARLAREGVEVRTFICSFGEMTHPHLQKQDISKIRVLESKKANHILGGSTVLFLGMREGHFLQDFKELHWQTKLLRHIHEFKPDVILTHAPDDPHPDHNAVYKIVEQIYDYAQLRADLYVFDVWTFMNIKKRKNPKIVVDITQTFARKLDALSAFKSQKIALFTLLWTVYVKAFYYGIKRGSRYAEVFYKVR